MNTKTCTIGLLALAGAAGVASATTGNVLLCVDLSVVDQVTITATDGLSDATISGSDGIGVYLNNFYTGAGATGLNETLVSGDLTNFLNASDGTPNLFRAGTADTGLNVFSWSDDSSVDFQSGVQAFTGSGTWDLNSDDYADMLAGNTFGDLYFPADDAGDVAGATLLGQYKVVVPAPAGLAVLGLGGLVAARRRR